MKEIRTFDKFILLLGFLIVIAIFILAYVIHSEGGQCAVKPCDYINKKNVTCIGNQFNIDRYGNYIPNINLSLNDNKK